ncbi:efflux RND transporter periplasmic adaptor subunit [Crateriforma conspicua]|uniref:Multidrug resistance protein MdtA n=1 Tax=Crateriforma conspicua TaxID=2527996 RepID=A0A5C5Y3A7_9PLAN|nr:efflux RND transporter periplasmic adaptor subunit [Crateriforma conspicua]TWT68745.1 Multidrug resistance protein MdtA precursor [Crateriforma conspicua]
MSSPPKQQSGWQWFRIIVSVVACAGILAGSVWAVVIINQTEPTAQTINAKRKSSALVETITVHRQTCRPTITVLGNVQSAQEVSLSPRVDGQIVELSPHFIPGGMVKAGDVLLKIDPADFENDLRISESELRKAEASLDIESGRQSLAQKELKLLEGTIEGTNRALVLREPQIASIRAEVAAAQAGVQRAKLRLERTKVLAPFDAQVLSRTVHVGSQVGTGDELGRLVGIHEYWVSAAVPLRSLRWIQFANPESVGSYDADAVPDGSEVILRDRDAWGPDVHRIGVVSRMIGALDQRTRLARVLISVADPLSLQGDDPPLIIDSLVDVEIQGRPIHDVIRLSRSYLRDGDTVWVMQDDELRIRQADVVFRDADHVYIRDGLNDGDEVVATTLATVADGVSLRKIESDDNEAIDSNQPEDAETASPNVPNQADSTVSDEDTDQTGQNDDET